MTVFQILFFVVLLRFDDAQVSVVLGGLFNGLL